MSNFAFTAALGTACLAVAACGGAETETNMADTNTAAAVNDTGGMENLDANASASGGTSTFASGSRIVEENGVTYRVDRDGTRVRLGENDSRIVVDNGTRYRVDPDGTRVRIGPDGASIDIDTPDIDLPDVDAGINAKGNPDIDVKDKGDGDQGPN